MEQLLKKWIAGCAAAGLIVSGTGGAMGASAAVLSPGDLNADGVIDTADAHAVLDYFSKKGLGLDDPDFPAAYADINHDGLADTEDAYLILSYFSYHGSGGKKSLEAWLTSPYDTEVIDDPVEDDPADPGDQTNPTDYRTEPVEDTVG